MAVPQRWNIHTPRHIGERPDMIRYSYARRCHIKTGTQCIILVKNPFLMLINDTVRSLSGSQRQNYTPFVFKICLVDDFGQCPAIKILKEGGFPTYIYMYIYLRCHERNGAVNLARMLVDECCDFRSQHWF